MLKPAGVVKQGLRDISGETGRSLDKSKTCRLFELFWKGQAVEGDSPVGKNRQACLKYSQVPRSTRNFVGIYRDHPERLNTPI